ncbi:methyltransferase family protein [Algoriphagus lacus]|nr:isoprenylcysteine carboxylmethyltransferase family protein [Algoriphagus lacus]
MVLSWGLFYSLHSALAASKLKRILKAKWPSAYKWYRLFYAVLSTLLFMGIIIQALVMPVKEVFFPSKFGQYAGYMIATGGVMIFLKSIKEISMKSFLGLRPNEQFEEEPKLVTTGMYTQVRHPLYLGMLFIFIGFFLVSGTVGALIHLICLLVYLPLGIYFEEKNLIAQFGESYLEYQKEVPAFFPKIHKKRA